MLTENQKSKLEPLTHHPKFGKLLIEAMKTWEISTPKQKTWGTTRFDKHYNLLAKWELSNQCCCLVGASMVGKTLTENDIIASVDKYFELDYTAWDLVGGFDSSDDFEFSTDAGNFGKQVADILFKS